MRIFQNLQGLKTILFRKFCFKINIKMDNVYIIRHENSDHFEMILKYKNDEYKLERRFNFNRKLDESVDTLINRMQTNIGKIFTKKLKKKKPKEGSELPNVDNLLVIELFKNGQNVNKSEICKDLFSLDKSLIQLKINDFLYNVKINSPWIESFKLPNSILSGFPVYGHIESIFTDVKLSEFNWYKKLPNEKNWETAGNGFFYTPSNADIGKFIKLKCIPKNNNDIGPENEVESNCCVDVGPGECPFEIRHQFTKEKLKNETFRVVTYNILADLYADSDYTRSVLFPYCPPYALSIDYRVKLILKELIGYNADIICLQEVDSKTFKNDILPVMSNLNFDGHLAKKGGGSVNEGVCCLYDTTRFKFIESQVFLLGEELKSNKIFQDLREKVKDNEAFLERITKLTSTLQVTLLKSLDLENSLVLLANVHLYFHPDADHIRLFQASMAIKCLEHLFEKFKSQYENTNISLIFCGDFNSVPECGIYRLYTTGSVQADYIDWSSNSNEAVKNVDVVQSFKLDSACGTPQFTNFTHGFADCLDYIFYEKEKFNVKQVVPLPSEEELRLNTALPSVVFPSDHVALIADLEWKN